MRAWDQRAGVDHSFQAFAVGLWGVDIFLEILSGFSQGISSGGCVASEGFGERVGNWDFREWGIRSSSSRGLRRFEANDNGGLSDAKEFEDGFASFDPLAGKDLKSSR